MSFRISAVLILASALAVPLTGRTQSPTPIAPIAVPPPVAPAPYLPFPNLPSAPLDEANNGIGIAQQTARLRKAQARILWIDGTANMNRVNTADKIATLVQQIKRIGFNTVVFDIKPIVGFTLYPSHYAPKLTEWKEGRTLPADFDPLAVMVARCHDAGLQLVVNMNTFSEGHRDFQKGPGYEHPQWQTTLYEPLTQVRPEAPGSPAFPLAERNDRLVRGREIAVYTDLARWKPEPGSFLVLLDGQQNVVALVEGTAFAAITPSVPQNGAALIGVGEAGAYLRRTVQMGRRVLVETTPVYVPISQRPNEQVPLMTNPHNTEVQRRLLDMIAEVVRNYAVDGVIFDDRLRYAGIHADFSEDTRRQFEIFVGKALHWPDDVFHFDVDFPSMNRQVIPGPQYDAWLLWRAQTIRNWLASAVGTVKAIRPNATVSAYSGSWYGEYPLFGANWAAEDFTAGFRFLTPSYQKTGYAGLVDWITTGCYYPVASMNEASAAGKSLGATVEAAGHAQVQIKFCHFRLQPYRFAVTLLRFAKRVMRAQTSHHCATQGIPNNGIVRSKLQRLAKMNDRLIEALVRT